VRSCGRSTKGGLIEAQRFSALLFKTEDQLGWFGVAQLFANDLLDEDRIAAEALQNLLLRLHPLLGMGDLQAGLCLLSLQLGVFLVGLEEEHPREQSHGDEDDRVNPDDHASHDCIRIRLGFHGFVGLHISRSLPPLRSFSAAGRG
jgi:hypothetical protein